MKTYPSREELIRILDYRPDTGEVYRRSTGKRVGLKTSQPYPQIRISGVTYQLHILCFIIHYGFRPDEVDHKDLDKYNLRANNLREANRSQNVCNRGAQKNNSSGFKGVHLHGSKWRYQIQFQGKRYSKTGFNSAEEASNELEKLRSSLHGEFSRS